MPDIFPPDYSTDLGKLRALVNDTNQYADPSVPGSDPAYMFSDDELGVYLGLHENVWLAAGFVVYTIASNEALVAKKIKTEDLQTDGAAVANALYQHANILRSEGLRRLELANDLADGIAVIDYQDPVTPEDRFDWVALGPGMGQLPGTMFWGV
jgi:hypothetical protein